MPTTFECPACHRIIAADPPKAGSSTQVQCPLCNEGVTVPVQTPPPAVESGGPMPYGGTPPGQLQQGMAVGALVCGIAGFVVCPLVGIVGIILGIIAIQRVNAEPHRYGGRGLAIGGICTGGGSLLVGLIMIPLMISILLPSLSRAGELSKRLVCEGQLRGLGTSMRIYANDWSQGFPPDFDVLVSSGEVTTKQFCCPSSGAIPGDVHACYVYIEGQTTLDDPRNVLVYEKPENHAGEGGNVLFLDGSVEFIRPYSRVEELVAETKRRIAEARRKTEDAAVAPLP